MRDISHNSTSVWFLWGPVRKSVHILLAAPGWDVVDVSSRLSNTLIVATGFLFFWRFVGNGFRKCKQKEIRNHKRPICHMEMVGSKYWVWINLFITQLSNIHQHMWKSKHNIQMFNPSQSEMKDSVSKYTVCFAVVFKMCALSTQDIPLKFCIPKSSSWMLRIRVIQAVRLRVVHLHVSYLYHKVDPGWIHHLNKTALLVPTWIHNLIMHQVTHMWWSSGLCQLLTYYAGSAHNHRLLRKNVNGNRNGELGFGMFPATLLFQLDSRFHVGLNGQSLKHKMCFSAVGQNKPDVRFGEDKGMHAADEIS